MPLFLLPIGHAIGGVIVQLLLSVLENPVFIKKVLVIAAEKAVKLTKSDMDEKILHAAEQILGVDADGNEIAPPPAAPSAP